MLFQNSLLALASFALTTVAAAPAAAKAAVPAWKSISCPSYENWDWGTPVIYSADEVKRAASSHWECSPDKNVQKGTCTGRQLRGQAADRSIVKLEVRYNATPGQDWAFLSASIHAVCAFHVDHIVVY